jgi:hypothetical protein
MKILPNLNDPHANVLPHFLAVCLLLILLATCGCGTVSQAQVDALCEAERVSVEEARQAPAWALTDLSEASLPSVCK